MPLDAQVLAEAHRTRVSLGAYQVQAKGAQNPEDYADPIAFQCIEMPAASSLPFALDTKRYDTFSYYGMP